MARYPNCFYIDKVRVRAPIRYDATFYPHIYGPFHRDSMITIREARRSGDATSLTPEPHSD